MLVPIVGSTYEKNKLPQLLIDLNKEDYITFKEYRIAYCDGRESISIGERLDGCKDRFAFPNRSTEDYIICKNCGNEYYYDELKEKSVIFKELIRINYQKIIEDIILKIQEAGCGVSNIEGSSDSYSLQVNEKKFLLIFDGRYSDVHFALLDEAIVNIKISESKMNGKLPDTVVSLSGIEIVFNGFGNEVYKLRDLPSSTELLARLEKISEVEKAILEKSKKMTWQVVENELTNYFLDQIRSRRVELYKYKLLSETYPMFSNVPVNAAGAGNADKITIPLANYLQEVFDGTFTVDAKCYSTTAVSSKTIETVQHHLSKDGFDARRIVIIATTNNVTCWEDVIHFKNTTGKYRLLIFNARLIAEVSVQLSFHEEFLRILEECVEASSHKDDAGLA